MCRCREGEHEEAGRRIQRAALSWTMENMVNEGWMGGKMDE